MNSHLTYDTSDNNADEIFFYCNGLSGLKSLCEFGAKDFIVRKILSI